MLQDSRSIAAAAVLSATGIVISIYQILCHLRNYTEPVFQRYIIRIIFMVPVYAIGSFCSLNWHDGAIYFDTIRDCYEAWIIYNFSSLLLAYVGGPGAVVVRAEGKQVHPSWGHMTCCLPTMQVDGFFLRRCKQGTLQFVLMKPLMAALTLVLYAANAYTDGDMSPKNGYFYISVLYNVCYTFALYGLLLFWIGASELLQPFNPLLKFVLVKTVVFLTFWQGIGISAINSMGKLSDPEDGKALQNFMICAEMALAGIALLFAFPHKEYQIGGSAAGFRMDAFMHAISIKDVISDTIHVFAPSYSDYVLYSDGGPADNAKRKKYRGHKTAAGEHPKASLMKNMDKGVLDDDDELAARRRSRTPADMKRLEAQRNQAILLDSDSDGIDSDEDEMHQGLGTDLGGGLSDSDGDNGDGNRLERPSTGFRSPSGSPLPARRCSSGDKGSDDDDERAGNAAEAGGAARTHDSMPSSGKQQQQTRRQLGRATSSRRAARRSAVGSSSAAQAGVFSAPRPRRRMLRGPILSDSSADDDAAVALANMLSAVSPGQQQQQQQEPLPSARQAVPAVQAAATAAGDPAAALSTGREPNAHTAANGGADTGNLDIRLQPPVPAAGQAAAEAAAARAAEKRQQQAKRNAVARGASR